MTIIGFNFTKIRVEKKQSLRGKVSINNNISVTNIVENDIALGNAKQKGLKFTIDFDTKYEPKIGSIQLTGEVLYIGEEKTVKEVLESWKKDKKVPKEIMAGVLNTGLNKCNIEALILSQQINLPPPIPLPKVETSKQ